MGFRIRKSFGKGLFRVNVSKSGIGYSIGVKGARITKTAKGTKRTTLNVPGTGISYVSETSKKRKRTSHTSNVSNCNNNKDKKEGNNSMKKFFNAVKKIFKVFFFITVFFFIFGCVVSKTSTPSAAKDIENKTFVSTSTIVPTKVISMAVIENPTSTPVQVTCTPTPTSTPTLIPTIVPTQKPTMTPVPVTTVWVSSQGGTKYHSKSSCSGMKNPKEITEDEAEELGYSPCKRCH